jgi:hypothetical protein
MGGDILSLFNVGDAVVCIDAADIPSDFTQLCTGKTYCIRSIEPIIGERSHIDNIHKKAIYCVRLWGVSNGNNIHGKEKAYAETRFEKMNDESSAMKIESKKRIAA